MNDISYSVAEWVVFNKEYVDTHITPSMSRDEILDVAKQCAMENISDISIEDIMSAFDDERVLLVVDFYYLRGAVQ